LTKTIENTQGQQGVDAERRQNQQATQARVTAALQTATEQVNQLTQQRDDLTAQLTKQQQDVKAKQAAVDELTTATSEQGRQQLADQLTTLRNAFIDEKQVQASLNNEAKNLTKQHQQTGNQSDALAQRLATAQTQLKQAETTVNIQNRDQSALANQVTAQQTLLQQQRDQLKTNAVQTDDQQQRWLAAAGMMEKAKSQLETLQSVQERYTNFYAGVRTVLQHRQQFPGVDGAVSELLTVPSDYTKAIEVALGGQLQNIVCETQQVAKTVVNFLKTQHYGRATFLPIDRIQARQLPSNTVRDLQQQLGVLGIASELVSCGDRHVAIKRYLLGTTVIVDTLDHALALSRTRRFRCKLVTVGGETIAASGAITGGATRHDDQGLLQQQQRSEQLAADIDKMQAALITHEQALAKAKQTAKDLTAQVETTQQRLSDLKDRYSQAQGQLQAAQSEQQQLARQVKALNYEQQQRADANDSYADQVARNQQALADNKAKLADYEQQMHTVEQQQNDYEQYQKAQAGKLQTQREALVTLTEHCKQTQQQVSQCAQQLATQQTAVTQAQSELATVKDTLSSQQLSGQERTERLASAQADQQKVVAQQATVQATLTDLNDAVAELSDDQTRTQQLAAAATDDYRRLELSQTKLTGEVEHATADLNEKYQLTVTAAQADVSDLDLPAITEQLKLLKRGLDEIGTVNLGAIDEFERVAQRYDFLTSQAVDLKAAKAHLLQTMADLDETVATRFKTAFDQVAQEFSQIFVQMIGGGKAELILTEPVNL